MSIIHKRWLRRSTVALGAALAMVFFAANPAAALSSHTATLQDASVIDIENGEVFELAGDPQCSDGLDNDGDGGTDLADGECVDANDDSECVAGSQSQAADPTFDFDDDGVNDETDNLSNFVVNFEPAEVCAQAPILGQVCFLIEIVVDSSSATADVVDVVPNTSAEIVNASPFDFTIDVEACDHDVPDGFDGTDCEVTFSNVSFSTDHDSPRGSAYDGATYTESGGIGQGTLATRIPSGPEFDEANEDCGTGVFGFVNWAEQLNDTIGLPNPVDVVLVQEVVPDLSSV